VVQERASLIMRELVVGRNVLYLDVDIVLLADPFPHLTPGYDIWTSMDYDVNRTRDHQYWNEKGFGTVHCTGVMGLLSTPRVIQFILDWEQHMEEGPPLSGNQKAFNAILNSPHNQDLVVMDLPDWAFPPGCLYFAPTFGPRRSKVVAVHNNWLVGHDSKKDRFWRHGLWLAASNIVAGGEGGTGAKESVGKGPVDVVLPAAQVLHAVQDHEREAHGEVRRMLEELRGEIGSLRGQVAALEREVAAVRSRDPQTCRCPSE
jgi:hypothetical protein